MRAKVHTLFGLLLSILIFVGCTEEDEDNLRCTIIWPYQLREGSEIVVFVGQMIIVVQTFSSFENSKN